MENYEKRKTKLIRRHLLIYSVSLLKTSSPVRTNSFHISDNPFKSNRLQRSTDDHLLSVPKSGQRQNPDCNVIFRVEKAQLFFTLQSVSHFGIGFVQFHLRRKIRSKFSICRLQFWFLRCCQQRWSYCPKFHSVMSQKVTENANLQNISTV